MTKVNSEEAWCDSDLESWVKKQRNALTLHLYERALWKTTIKRPIVAVNVKLIGLTLWEELLSSPDPSILRVTAGFSCVPLPVLLAAPQPLIPRCKKPHKHCGKGLILKLAWKRWSCSFCAKCPYKKKLIWTCISCQKAIRGETLERSQASRHVKNVKLNVLIWTDRIGNFL